MQYASGWISPLPAKTGLDHLGAQAVCVNIYGRLIPGITNVTDRARYYSFYPWLIWSHREQAELLGQEEYRERFRRADCLFTLVAERHARLCARDDHIDHERHGIAMVGRDTLLPALDRLEQGGGDLDLSRYATLEDLDDRYFQNPWGGLGQYYRGTLEELGIVVSDSRTGARFTEERGEPIAQAFGESVPGDQFLDIVSRGWVGLSELDALSMFCPCSLPECNLEHQALVDMFFCRRGDYLELGDSRPRTLGLLLHLAGELENLGRDLEQPEFVAAAYSAALPNGLAWTPPDALQGVKKHWETYARNELLSLAAQSIFYAALALYDRDPDAHVAGAADLAAWVVATPPVSTALHGIGEQRIEDFLVDLRDTLPPLSKWGDPSHELRLLLDRRSLLQEAALGEDGIAALLATALRSLLSLTVRDSSEDAPYSDLPFEPGYLEYYPVNLLTLHEHARSTWKEHRVRDVLAWLIANWGVETHLRVALRKLRYDIRETFRIRPTDQGLEVIEASEPVPTTPRFDQSVQVLRDLGALERSDEGLTRPTALGRQLLEAVVNG
jgi:hypothetical protein